MDTAASPAKLSKNDNYSVNKLTGAATLNVVGSNLNGKLDKKIAAIFAALPEGSFVRTPKALWRSYVDCNVRGGTQAYEIRFQVRDAAAVDQALYAMKYGV